MSSLVLTSGSSGAAGREWIGWRRFLTFGENLALVAVLLALVVLPLLEMVLRRFDSGVSGSISFVQKFALVVGMIGGAIAARENRLLSLSTFTTFLKGRAQSVARFFSYSFSAVLCAFLGFGSLQFVLSERLAGGVIAYGIPIWIFQLIMPVGFAAIAGSLIWHSAQSWKGRSVGLLSALAVVVSVMVLPLEPARMVLPALIGLLVATFLGAPIFAVLGGVALILLWGAELPISSIAIKHHSLVDQPLLPTLPLFTLAGYFLAEGGASRRLVAVFQGWFGHLRGGPVVASVLVCAFFTSFTGASGVTILALGGLLLPVLMRSGLTERRALGILTGSGSLGMLFPPCVPLIVYAMVAGIISANLGVPVDISIEKMFLGGIGPGVLMVVLAAGLGCLQSPAIKVERPKFDLRSAWAALWEAKWELMLPVVALVPFFTGLAVPIEAAALTAFYALFIETFVYRDLRVFRDLPRVMTECGLLIGGVLLILGVAMGLSYYLTFEMIPDQAVDWVQANIHSKLVFLLVLNVFLLLVGCLMDVFSAIVVVVPLILPMGLAFGIDPVHLGIIFLANLELGYLTPPVGMNLFLSSYRFDKPVLQVARSVIPILLVLLAGVLVITYFPALTTFLPGLLD
ncbi:MAG: TRAP transporter large permease subunit [Opitutaceae bacterium]